MNLYVTVFGGVILLLPDYTKSHPRITAFSIWNLAAGGTYFR